MMLLTTTADDFGHTGRGVLKFNFHGFFGGGVPISATKGRILTETGNAQNTLIST